MPKPAIAAAFAAAIASFALAALAPAADASSPAAATVRSIETRGVREAMQLGLRPAPEPASPGELRNARAARIALRYLGTPYSYGGASPSGFDCSGLVYFAYHRVGTTLPHSSYALWDAGRRVPRTDLRPGDLVFFNGFGHVGIAIGGGRFVHSPQTGGVVEVVRLSERDDFLGAVRV